MVTTVSVPSDTDIMSRLRGNSLGPVEPLNLIGFMQDLFRLLRRDSTGNGQFARGQSLTSFKDPAAQTTAPPTSPTSGKLGLAATIGAVFVSVTTAGGGTASTTDKATVFFTLPPSYTAAGAITVRVRAKTSALATVKDAIDLVAKKVDDTIGSDICATNPIQTTTSYANYDFTVTPTGLVAGDILALEINANRDDTGGAISGNMSVSKVWVLCDSFGG